MLIGILCEVISVVSHVRNSDMTRLTYCWQVESEEMKLLGLRKRAKRRRIVFCEAQRREVLFAEDLGRDRSRRWKIHMAVSNRFEALTATNSA